jgi:N-acetylneuraminate synthase
LELIASKGKPVLLATGASELWEVERAVKMLQNYNIEIVIMQCNTNYTGMENNYDYQNLLVLNEYRKLFPNTILGLSDHSIGHTAVIGAVALGAKVIEKHFTDDTSRIGPDHSFSLDPSTWANMVTETRILERCLGDGHKKIEANELESRIVQRRALRYTQTMQAGKVINESDLIALRPCPKNGIDPFDIDKIIGKTLNRDVELDQLVNENDFRSS